MPFLTTGQCSDSSCPNHHTKGWPICIDHQKIGGCQRQAKGQTCKFFHELIGEPATRSLIIHAKAKAKMKAGNKGKGKDDKSKGEGEGKGKRSQSRESKGGGKREGKGKGDKGDKKCWFFHSSDNKGMCKNGADCKWEH